MKRILPFFTIVGALGYLTSIVSYLLTFWDFNAESLTLYLPLTFMLMVTWLITILKLIKDPEIKNHQRGTSKNTRKLLKIIFKGTPKTIQFISAISFFFAMISFAYLVFIQPGVVGMIDGEQVIHDHGTVIKKLTDKEYQHALAVGSRQFLGHYIGFFGVAIAILYPGKTD